MPHSDVRILGLIGGTTWLSTVEYYTHINRLVNEQLGGDTSAELVLASLNFAEVVENNDKDDLEANYRIFFDAAIRLKAAGAEALVPCANTMHMYADRFVADVGLPVIHIAAATAVAARAHGCKRVAVLGTRYTMSSSFYPQKMAEAGIETVFPSKEDRESINRAIFDELVRDVFKPETKRMFVQITERLVADGVDGVALACTEIPLLIKQEDVSVPVFDTTRIHAQAAVAFSLSN